MVDLMSGFGTAAPLSVRVQADRQPDKDGSLKCLMGRAQGVLKSRWLSVLGSSNDLISGISTKLESALSLSVDSSETESADHLTCISGTSKAIGNKQIPALGLQEFDNSPVIRKLRLPNFGKGTTFEDYEAMSRHRIRKATAPCKLSPQTPSYKSGLSPVETEPEICATASESYTNLNYKTEAPSSESASDQDVYGPSTSMDQKFWNGSGSDGSIQSWASSVSLASQSDESVVEFMRAFVGALFKESSAIPLEHKSKFGLLAQNETGRLWFARFVNSQRVRTKLVDESTFYSLVQFFAIVLFECADADDFSPAKSLMNMCFTFYHEVEVPGCEPYREYLYTYLREQHIWRSLRFWNAAFFDALQCERAHRPVPTAAPRVSGTNPSQDEITDDCHFQENITFGQLGTFTCNMHAFGLSRELCTEFLRKQCTIANLSKEQEKMLRDNIERMYSETDPWR